MRTEAIKAFEMAIDGWWFEANKSLELVEIEELKTSIFYE